VLARADTGTVTLPRQPGRGFARRLLARQSDRCWAVDEVQLDAFLTAIVKL